jgi:hypothetical protein
VGRSAASQRAGRAPSKPSRRDAAGRATRGARDRGPLIPEPDLRGPKVLLGIGWAGVIVVGVLAGPIILALVLAPFAASAAAQAAQSWRRVRGRHRPASQAAFAAAGVVVLGAAFGVPGLIAASLVAAVGAAAWATTIATSRAGDEAAGSDIVLTLACAAVPAAAAVGPVILRTNGLVAALVMVTYALAYDAAAWVIGSGSRHRWVGPLAGMACIASITLGVGSVFPQFKGNSAWELGFLAAVLTPLGPIVAGLVVGDRRSRIPAVRRLDSLVLLGPVWAFAAARMGV